MNNSKHSIVFLVVLMAISLDGSLSAKGQTINLAGPQIWNVDYWQTVHIGDFYGPNYEILKLKPISMVGCRNGSWSGWVVITCSTYPMTGLKASVSDLVNETGKKIPASRILVRYSDLAHRGTSWAPPYRFDRLLEEPLEEIQIVDMRQQRRWKPKKVGPIAMQPVWVTVPVPKDAVPGTYKGEFTVEIDDNEPLKASVEMKVHDWTLPDPKNYTVKHMVWLSPDQVAKHYEVEMWSDKHFELMEKSLKVVPALGSFHVDVNLVVRYLSRDNHDTMVKWIRQPDGSFKYDFTVFDRYMDLVQETIGKPFPIRLNMWSSQVKPYHSVLVVDPATGKTEELEQPPQGTAESYAFWKPVMDEIRARTDKRGWSDVLAPNWHQYCGGPDTNTVSMLKRIWPDARWADMDHGRRRGFKGVKKSDYTPVIIQSTVWNEGRMTIRGYKGRLKPGVAFSGHARGRTREWFSLWDYRVVSEEQILKGNHGVDPMGGDLWPARDRRGRYSGGRWAACALGPGNCTKAILGPGPNGAIGTERYEAFREGVQICEAVLFIHRCIESGKLEPKLAAKAGQVIDERAKHRMRSWVLRDKSGKHRFDASVAAENAIQEEDTLWATAAEVAAAMK